MFSKDEFVKFLERSYLNKSVETLILEVKNQQVSTYFKSDDIAMGQVLLDKFDQEDCEIGIYYPDVLLKMLSILDNEITLKIEKNKNQEVTALKFKDKKGKSINFATSNLEIFDRPEKKAAKTIDYDVKINLNTELISDVLKSTAVLSTDRVNFIYENDKLFIVFGYSTTNTSQIKFELDCENVSDIGNIPFKSKILKEVLSINAKNFKSGSLEINNKGLMRIYFEEENNTAEYYFLKLSDAAEDSE